MIGNSIPKFGNTIAKIGNSIPKARHTISKVGNTIPKVGNGIPKVRNSIPKVRNRLPKTQRHNCIFLNSFTLFVLSTISKFILKIGVFGEPFISGFLKLKKVVPCMTIDCGCAAHVTRHTPAIRTTKTGCTIPNKTQSLPIRTAPLFPPPIGALPSLVSITTLFIVKIL